jgi:hypothetical protein
MKEWHRSVVLLIMLAITIGFIVYLRVGYEHHILHALGR